MLDLISRNLTQRRLRTGLTIFGIALGIFALVVMGAMSENFNGIFEKTMELEGTKIRVVGSGGPLGGALSDEKVSRVRKVEGIRDAYGIIQAPVKKGQIGMTSDIAIGIPPEKLPSFLGSAKLIAGRMLEIGDTTRTVIGNSLAREYDLKVGNTLEINEKNFTVVGILEYTGSGFDFAAYIPLKKAQELYAMEGRLNAIFAVPARAADAEQVARQIKLNVEDVEVITTAELRKQVEQSLLVFTVITTGAAIIAAIIGGFSVMNTMLMSVSERTREFGILKAIGAETKDILIMLVGEAAIMGIIGGILGILAGYGFSSLLNSWLGAKGTTIFLVTPRLILIAIAFAVLLGALSGVYPAYRASRLNPVEALRHE